MKSTLNAMSTSLVCGFFSAAILQLLSGSVNRLGDKRHCQPASELA